MIYDEVIEREEKRLTICQLGNEHVERATRASKGDFVLSGSEIWRYFPPFFDLLKK